MVLECVKIDEAYYVFPKGKKHHGKDQQRRDLYIVTEYRDGCVYRTRKIGEVYLDWDIVSLSDKEILDAIGEGDLLVSCSTRDLRRAVCRESQ